MWHFLSGGRVWDVVCRPPCCPDSKGGDSRNFSGTIIVFRIASSCCEAMGGASVAGAFSEAGSVAGRPCGEPNFAADCLY